MSWRCRRVILSRLTSGFNCVADNTGSNYCCSTFEQISGSIGSLAGKT
jgi:hypothetical protein